MAMYVLSDIIGRESISQLTPEAIRHLPASRQRRYVRLSVLGALRRAIRDLSAMEIHDLTDLDPRTIRRELARLEATREVEMIARRRSLTYRPIGRPLHLFGKHLIPLGKKAYTLEPVRTAQDEDVLVIQERRETEDGAYEPVGGITVLRDELKGFIEVLKRRAEESFEETDSGGP